MPPRTPKHALLPATLGDRINRRLNPPPNPYANDVAGWLRDKTGEHLWSKQREVAQSVIDNRFTAVKSCHQSGKSFLAARIAAWWLDTHKPGEAFVVTTAPTDKQVKTILWRELQRTHGRAKLDGRITQDAEWKMPVFGNDEIVAYGRKPADHDDHGFQGIHARFVLVIIDEACGVPPGLWKAVDTLVGNDNARVLAIGNPDDPASQFATNCSDGSIWNVIRISAFDTPSFTGEHVPDIVKEMLVQPTWVQEREQVWGIGSPAWISKVTGEFPDVREDLVFSPRLILKMQHNDLELPGLPLGRYAFDISRHGENETLGYRNRGGVIREAYVARGGQDTMVTADAIALVMKATPGVEAWIDADGMGWGVYDRLNQLGHPVHPWQGGLTPKQPMRFYDRRSEAYWLARVAGEADELDIDPADDVLAAQLGLLTWWEEKKGQYNVIRVETKDSLKQRGFPSPDRADAFVMSNMTSNGYKVTKRIKQAAKDPSSRLAAQGMTGDLLDREW